jgi:predicted nucleic acid-binding protein
VNELAHPHRAFDPLDLSAIKFIEVRAPRDQQRVAQYAAALDRGEAEAIVLAIELGTMLLIDELMAARHLQPLECRSSVSWESLQGRSATA